MQEAAASAEAALAAQRGVNAALMARKQDTEWQLLAALARTGAAPAPAESATPNPGSRPAPGRAAGRGPVEGGGAGGGPCAGAGGQEQVLSTGFDMAVGVATDMHLGSSAGAPGAQLSINA